MITSNLAGRDAGRHRLAVGPDVPAGPFGITHLSAKGYNAYDLIALRA
jgi:hypothetical protein